MLLWEYKLLGDLLPELDAYIKESGGKKSPLWDYLGALDADAANEELSNGVRLACLIYPFFFSLLRQEERRSPNGRVNRQHVARRALHAVTQRLHIPKATLYTAQALMDVPRRFADSPTKGRGRRFLSHPSFPEALAFQRILLTAERPITLVSMSGRHCTRSKAGQRAQRETRDDTDAPRDAEKESGGTRRRSAAAVPAALRSKLAERHLGASKVNGHIGMFLATP